MKVFLSQPTKERSKEEITRERKQMVLFAKKFYGSEDITVINSYFKEGTLHELELYRLGKAIKLLSTADVVLFAPNYENTRSCAIEHLCAEKYIMSWVDIADDFETIKGMGF